MYYIEVLRTWRAFWRYLIVLAGLLLLASFMGVIVQHVHTDAGRTYTAGGHAVLVAFICLLIASAAGSSLSRHMDHLDFALTKPRPRTAFIWSVLGVDLLGLTVFFIATTIWMVAIHVASGLAHGVTFTSASWLGIAIAFGSVLAWYAIVQAASCTQDATGWALASIWVAALTLHFLSAANLGPGLNALVAGLNLVNPIAYLSTVPFEGSEPASASLAVHAVAIYGVAALAALVAMFRWQRVEA